MFSLTNRVFYASFVFTAATTAAAATADRGGGYCGPASDCGDGGGGIAAAAATIGDGAGGVGVLSTTVHIRLAYRGLDERGLRSRRRRRVRRPHRRHSPPGGGPSVCQPRRYRQLFRHSAKGH